MSRGSRFAVIALVATLPIIGHAQGLDANRVQVVPPAPRYMESVRLRIDPRMSICLQRNASVSMVANKITVRVPVVFDLCGNAYDLDLGRFPAGTYDVEAFVFHSGESLGTASFTVSPSDVPPVPVAPQRRYHDLNFSGLWWDPGEPGWGLSIIHHINGTLFATWYQYGTNGEAVWYTIQGGSWTSRDTFEASIFKHSGPPLNGPYDRSLLQERPVGRAVLRFYPSALIQSRFDYTVEGMSGTKRIERFKFD
jgi:hypothetical protein